MRFFILTRIQRIIPHHFLDKQCFVFCFLLAIQLMHYLFIWIASRSSLMKVCQQAIMHELLSVGVLFKLGYFLPLSPAGSSCSHAGSAPAAAAGTLGRVSPSSWGDETPAAICARGLLFCSVCSIHVPTSACSSEWTGWAYLSKPHFHNHCLVGFFFSGDLITQIWKVSTSCMRKRISGAQILRIPLFTHLSTCMSSLIGLLLKRPEGTTVIMVFDFLSGRVQDFLEGLKAWDWIMKTSLLCRALKETDEHRAVPCS